ATFRRMSAFWSSAETRARSTSASRRSSCCSARRRASSARATSISSARSAASARMVTRSSRTSRKPPVMAISVSSLPRLRRMTPGLIIVSRGACMGRTVSSPSMPGATISSTPSWERTRRSAVTISTVNGIGCGSAVGTRNTEQGLGRDKVRRLGDGVRRDGSRTEFAGEISCCDRPFVPQGDNVGSCGVFLHLVGLLLGFFDGTDHVERLLGEVVPLAFKDFFEATDGVLDADVAALAAGEDFGDEHGLREEALDAARSRNSLLVLLRELFGAEDGDDVLEVSEALPDSLYAAGRVVVLLT